MRKTIIAILAVLLLIGLVACNADVNSQLFDRTITLEGFDVAKGLSLTLKVPSDAKTWQDIEGSEIEMIAEGTSYTLVLKDGGNDTEALWDKDNDEDPAFYIFTEEEIDESCQVYRTTTIDQDTYFIMGGA